MARAKKVVQEFTASYGDADLTQAGTVPEPVVTGNSARPADAATGDPGAAGVMSPGQEQNMDAVVAQSRSMMVKQIMDAALSAKGDELAKLYGVMFPPGSENPADVVAPNAAASNLASISTHNEDLDDIFANTDLTPEAKARFKVLFESAVAIRAGVVEAELEDEYQAKLEENVSEAIDTMVEQVDKYLSEAAKQYLVENELGLVDTARVQIAEGFMIKMKGLLNESFFDLETDKGALATITAELEATKAIAIEEMTKNKQLTESLANNAKDLVVEKASYGLSLSEREKLKTISETVEFTTPADFEGKIKILVESKVRTPVKGKPTEQLLISEGKEDNQPKYLDAGIAELAKHLV